MHPSISSPSTPSTGPKKDGADSVTFAANYSLLAAVSDLADFLKWANTKPDVVNHVGAELTALAANHRRVQMAVQNMGRPASH